LGQVLTVFSEDMLATMHGQCVSEQLSNSGSACGIDYWMSI